MSQYGKKYRSLRQLRHNFKGEVTKTVSLTRKEVESGRAKLNYKCFIQETLICILSGEYKMQQKCLMSSFRKIGLSTALQMRVFGSVAVFVQYERYVTAVLYHLAGINGLHQRQPDGCLMCAKGTCGRALAQTLTALNQSSAGRTCACVCA